VKLRFLVVWGLLLLLCCAGSAQVQSNGASSPIDVSAARVEYTQQDGVEITRFSGDVVFTTARLKVSAAKVELHGSGDKIVADNQVAIYFNDPEENRQGEAQGGHLEYDRTQGYLLITLKPRLKLSLAGESEPEEPREVEIFSEKMELWTETDRALATGKVLIRQPDFEASGEQAEFFLAEEKLVLSGEPQVKRGQNTFRGELITIYIKTGQMNIEGNVTGQVSGESMDEPAAKQPVK